MNFSYKSLPASSEKNPYSEDRSIPKGFTASEEIASPGDKTFWCPGCNLGVVVSPLADREYWHYRGICPQCEVKWSNVYLRFKKRKEQQTATVLDWEPAVDLE